MEIQLSAEQEAQLNQLATRVGRAPVQLVQDAVDQVLQYDAHFRAAAAEGFDALDRGDFIEEEEMDARITLMLHG